MGFVLSPPSILTSLSSIFIVDFWVFTFEWGNKIRIRKYVLVGLFQTHQFFVRFCFHCDANVRGQPQISHKVTNKLCVMRGRALSGAASWYFLAHNSEGSPVLYCPVRVAAGSRRSCSLLMQNKIKSRCLIMGPQPGQMTHGKDVLLRSESPHGSVIISDLAMTWSF